MYKTIAETSRPCTCIDETIRNLGRFPFNLSLVNHKLFPIGPSLHLMKKGRKRRTWKRGHGQSRSKSLDFKSEQTCADCCTDFQVEARFYAVNFNLKNDKTPLSGYVMLPLRTYKTCLPPSMLCSSLIVHV